MTVIDGPVGFKIGVTEDDRIVRYSLSEFIEPDQITLNSQDVTGKTEITGDRDDKLVLQFSESKTGILKTGATQANPSFGLLIDFNRPIQALPPGKGGGGGAITVQRGGSLRKRNSDDDKILFDRRENSSSVIVPLDKDVLLGEVAIAWSRNYHVSRIGLVPIYFDGFTARELNAVKAVHSTRGDVLKKLKTIDKEYAEIDAGEYIDLSFEALSSSENTDREFVLTTTGRYLVPSAGDHIIPSEFYLDANYPNPFNPATTIRYGLKTDSRVVLKVYNLLGQEVRTLVDARESAGFKEAIWDGRNNQGHRVASGVYIYKLTAGSFTKARKLMLVK